MNDTPPELRDPVAALLRHIGSSARLLTEEAAEAELAAILNEFAQAHDRFLRRQHQIPEEQ